MFVKFQPLWNANTNLLPIKWTSLGPSSLYFISLYFLRYSAINKSTLVGTNIYIDVTYAIYSCIIDNYLVI